MSRGRAFRLPPDAAIYPPKWRSSEKRFTETGQKTLMILPFFRPIFPILFLLHLQYTFVVPPLWVRSYGVAKKRRHTGGTLAPYWRRTGAEVSTDVNRMSPAPVIVSLLELCINVTARGIRTYSATLRPPAPDAPSERTRSPYSRSRRRHTPYPVRCATRSLSHRYLSAGRRGNSTCRRRTG